MPPPSVPPRTNLKHVRPHPAESFGTPPSVGRGGDSAGAGQGCGVLGGPPQDHPLGRALPHRRSRMRGVTGGRMPDAGCRFRGEGGPVRHEPGRGRRDAFLPGPCAGGARSWPRQQRADRFRDGLAAPGVVGGGVEGEAEGGVAEGEVDDQGEEFSGGDAVGDLAVPLCGGDAVDSGTGRSSAPPTPPAPPSSGTPSSCLPRAPPWRRTSDRPTRYGCSRCQVGRPGTGSTRVRPMR